MENKLFRSPSEKMIGGVCGGLAQHFKIDPTLIRLAFILLFFFGGHGLLLYLILWVIMPGVSEVKTGDGPSDPNTLISH